MHLIDFFWQKYLDTSFIRYLEQKVALERLQYEMLNLPLTENLSTEYGIGIFLPPRLNLKDCHLKKGKCFARLKSLSVS